jgi:hypothetical protein
LKYDGTCAETRFRLSAKRTSPFKSAGGVSSVDYWQASCAHQPVGFVLPVQACVLQSRDAYWLHTAFARFPFNSPPVRHRVPSHFNWTPTIFALPRQQWLRERALILCYTYTACIVLVSRYIQYLLTASKLFPLFFKYKGHPCTGTEVLYRPYGP